MSENQTTSVRTRAKFTCKAVSKSLHWDKAKGFIYTAEFLPVTSGSPENEQFYAATPGGSITLAAITADVSITADVFEPGKAYYVDFTPAD